jgi:hypothetical protein
MVFLKGFSFAKAEFYFQKQTNKQATDREKNPCFFFLFSSIL